MLSLAELLLLVGIGAVGLFLALPRGPESESRAVKSTGGVLCAVSILFLALATRDTWRSLPGWADSRLRSPSGSLLFHGLALVAVLSGGAAVTSRSPRWSSGALAGLLGASGGLIIFAGLTWIGVMMLAVGVGTGTIVLTRRRAHGSQSDVPRDRPGESAIPFDIAREPVLACTAGALLAAGMLAAAHSAVANELPLTAAIERHARPASHRYRAFPRTSLVGFTLGGKNESGRTVETSSRDIGDLPLLCRLLSTAALLFAVGLVGLLVRRSLWGCGVSAAVAASAIVLLVAAFSVLPFHE